jgi:hypothetical protein
MSSCDWLEPEKMMQKLNLSRDMPNQTICVVRLGHKQ